MLTPDDIRYPMDHLQKMSRKIPEQLFCKGDLDLLLFEHRNVAIVGTREPTDYGFQLAYDIAYRFAKHGKIIVSGLAYGIDTAAHMGALDAGGKTIAVLGSSLDPVYPPENKDLANRIIKNNGLVITEYSTDLIDLERFEQRDKIIAALSADLIPVQATYAKGKLSGTLKTIVEGIRLKKKIIIPEPDLEDAKANPKQYEGLKYLNIVYGKRPNVVIKKFQKKEVAA